MSPLLFALKLDKLLLAGIRKKCCIIHFKGVRSDNSDPFNGNHMPLKEFEQCLIYLKENYRIITVWEAFANKNAPKENRKKMIALTFDRGYKNNFDLVLPLLAKHKIPATFYIIARGLEKTDFLVWPDAIDILTKRLTKDLIVGEKRFIFPGFRESSSGQHVVDYLKKQGSTANKLVESLIEQHRELVFGEVEKHPQWFKLIDAKQLAMYANQDIVEFGSHCYDHPNLENVSGEALKFQLLNSKNILEDVLKAPVTSVAFPDGSYNEETLQSARDIGYREQLAGSFKRREDIAYPDLLQRFPMDNSATWQSNMLRLAREFDKFGF